MRSVRLTLLVVLFAASLRGQEPLTLRQAVNLGLLSNPTMTVENAGEREAEARVQRARSAYFPNVEYSESFQRGNDPVFVFTSLLTQRQFREQDFAVIGSNRSQTLNNYQSRLTAEQILFDGAKTTYRVQAAGLTRQLARENTREAQATVVLQVLESYFGAVLADRNLEVSRASVESAEADLVRAQSIYESGRSTQAEVLALRVHLAAMHEQQLRAANQSAIARAALDEAMGVDLDRNFVLTTPLDANAVLPEMPLEEYARLALENRAELRESEIMSSLTHKQYQLAEAAYWPDVVAQATLQADRQEFSSDGGASWLAGVTLRWNVWNGGETRARVKEARSAESRVNAMLRKSTSAIQLEIRRAYGDMQTAAMRIQVASAASAEAEEAHRIIQNRHDSGLTTVTELLRSEAALTAARTRYLAAVYDHRVAAAVLARAAGVLAADSAQVN